MIQLRPRQIDVIERTKKSIRDGHRAPILVAPTGSGKTVCGSAIIEGAESKSRSSLFLVHRYELMEQASLKLADFGISHNIVAPSQSVRQIKVEHFKRFGRSYVDHRAGCDIATVQTKSRRIALSRNKYDLIIPDECHLSIANSYRKVYAESPNAILCGLTATPNRLDGKGLGVHCGGVYDDLVIMCQPQDLIDDGLLVPFRFFSSPHNAPDVSKVPLKNGEFDQNIIGDIMSKREIIGDALDHYQSVAHKRPAMYFCASIKQAEKTAQSFRDAGYKAIALSGQSTAYDRDCGIKGLGDGSMDLVFNCQLYIEGLDQPAISVIGMLAHTNSLTRFMQMCGRGGRIHGTKTDCIVFDHVNNVLRHGFPTDDREWSLDGAKKRRKNEVAPVSVMRCHACYAMFKPSTHCPQCGAAMVAGAVRREIKQVEGTLVEITPEQRKAQQIARRIDIRKCRTYEELLAYAEQQGYQYPSAWSRKQLQIREQYKSKRAAQ